MKTETYIPQPVDTKDVELPEELKPLVEQMAKNVHEIWSETRISQGWSYGPERNDAEKKHPCLLPYEQLPEEEKVYDRNTSVETLKFILKAGFEISPRVS
ncbi:MAG: Ryanodine receptor Ryr [Prevotella sp.]|nr:Ryanodine receptor Ryr [Prevotella sp.]